MENFAEWESFYVIIGTSAAALIGLQFVVMTLIAERPQAATAEAGAAFAAPTVVHFGVVLFLAAILRIPWQSMTTIAALWGCVGFAGVIYGALVIRRMRRQTTYRPDAEDWLFHALAPLTAYVLLVVSAFAAALHSHESLLILAAGVLVLLFTSIHNVWDTVYYQVFVRLRKPE